MTDLRERVTALQKAIGEGKIIEALHEFYATDVVMQENEAQPVRGLQANLKREEEWLDSVAEFRNFEVLSLAVDGNTSFVESAMTYVDKQGNEVGYAQVARAKWKDGKIVDERFYHG